jgi:hypothetical protein
MADEYSVQTICALEDIFHEQNILRPFRIQRYEPGTELYYEIKGVTPPTTGRIKLEIVKFVGGGYAGQVYQVKALEVQVPHGSIEGLETGGFYALKILLPPSGFAKWFRSFIYTIAFQGPFSLQVNPSAARAGALWQKMIRRGAKSQFGSEKAVVDILATFIDHSIGSCGEISEWIKGRTWRLEADDNLDARWKWQVGNIEKGLGSPEYRAKKAFMSDLVMLMHDMGAPELARQYTWWTCKSQPNSLKRSSYNSEPSEGLVAVDFRAGLALLPFLPMSPADFKLIFKGIIRGSLVQFDRGNIKKFEGFIKKNPESFSGMERAIEELKKLEKEYRDSLPDIAHHHLKLLISRNLWSSIITSSIKSWAIRNFIDKDSQIKLQRKKFLSLFFYLIGIFPFLGNFIRRLLGHANIRRHYKLCLTRISYFRRALKARIAEKLVLWHRKGRVDEKKALNLVNSPLRFFSHIPLSLLPARLHRFFSDRAFFLRSLDNIFARPIRLYFKAEVREQWLQDMISQGKGSGMLSKEEASSINAQIKEPYIQKYLKSLAVHICTAPVTQIVSIIIAIIYIRLHPELSWQEASLHAGLILGFFQITPISPGSLVRGLYVTGLVIRERNFKDYNIAFYLSFFKYIGYLAFPIQMAYRYPDLARFMAAHWATGAAHIVPVFGERGALLEHSVFDIFYNYPLTLRKRILERKKLRDGSRPRYWHLSLTVLSGTLLFAGIEWSTFSLTGLLPQFKDFWWLFIWVPALAAAATSFWAKGAALSRRILIGAACGALLGVLHAALSPVLSTFLSTGGANTQIAQSMTQIAMTALWRVFLYAVIAIFGACFAETRPLRPEA